MKRTLNEASHGLMYGGVSGFPVGHWVKHNRQSSGQHCRLSLTNRILTAMFVELEETKNMQEVM